MYKIAVFMKNMQTNFVVGYKDEGLAKSMMENIRERRRLYLEQNEDSICTISGDDYGYFDVLSSEIIATALLFHADGVQIPLAKGLQ